MLLPFEIFKKELENLYINQRKSSPEIARIYGVSKSTIKRRLRKYGIPRRTNSEAQRGLQIGPKNSFYGKMHSKESKRKMSESLKGKIAGSKHPNWNPDREWVRINEKLHDFMKAQLRKILYDKAGIRTQKLLGYTPRQLKKHLEKQFESWMTWDNYGNGINCWNIDHIIPVSYYLKIGCKDPKIINALNNLQPLLCKDNFSKRDKIMRMLP